MDATFFQNAVLTWYDQSKRDLPWRNHPNPYQVWISEIMLQQTRVEAVIPYYIRFIKEVPTIYDLAHIEDDKLSKLWEGLGYYSRARNLKKAAIKVCEEYFGKIPDSKEELLSLPGIGPYTAGAILSIAFDKKEAAVDGNVLRVFARLNADSRDLSIPKIKKSIEDEVISLLPDTRNGDFTQALMEIGATICLPNGEPICQQCPLGSICLAKKNNLTQTIPMKKKKIHRKIEKKTVLILEFRGSIYLQQRANKGLLAGLYEFDLEDGHLHLGQVHERFPNALQIHELPESKHIFTHLEWWLLGFHILLDSPIPNRIAVSRLDIKENYSIPTAYRTYTEYLLK